MQLSWTDNCDKESGFRIERATGAGGTAFTEVATVGANVRGATVGSLSPNTTYRFRVRAYNDVGPSAYSNIANATTPAQPPNIVRFVNDTSYPIVYLTVDGQQLFPASPSGILPGYYYDVAVSAGSHAFQAANGHWDTQTGQRFLMYQWSGSWSQAAGTVHTVSIPDPTINQLLANFGSTAYWDGYYFDESYNYHTVSFLFYSSGTWYFYRDGSLVANGNYSLVERRPYEYTVLFKVSDHPNEQGLLSELQGMFYMNNGSSNWPVVTYTRRL